MPGDIHTYIPGFHTEVGAPRDSLPPLKKFIICYCVVYSTAFHLSYLIIALLLCGAVAYGTSILASYKSSKMGNGHDQARVSPPPKPKILYETLLTYI